ncbi:hypothetical protein ACPA9J_24570 [Pseudomonas aeruginosa]
MSGTDLEVELVGRVVLEGCRRTRRDHHTGAQADGHLKSLPNDVLIDIRVDEQKLLVKAGRSRFTLSTLPANDFPTVEEGPAR